MEHALQEEKKKHLDAYPWSSYPDYVSSSRYNFLVTDEILAYFKENKASYRTFVEEGISESVNPLEKGRGYGIIGDTSFIREILKRIDKTQPLREQPAIRRMISKAVGGAFHVILGEITEKNYKGPARSVAMELLYRYVGINQREIGDMMGVDYSSVRWHEKGCKNRLQEIVPSGSASGHCKCFGSRIKI